VQSIGDGLPAELLDPFLQITGSPVMYSRDSRTTSARSCSRVVSPTPRSSALAAFSLPSCAAIL